MKYCKKCDKTKALSEFSKDKSSKDGLQARCKACKAAWQKENSERCRKYIAAWRKANPERCNASSSAWKKANPEKNRARAAAWSKANPEKKIASNAAWVKANPEKSRAFSSAWRKANPEKSKARSAAWQKANPEKCRAHIAKRRATKLQRTPSWADIESIKEFYESCPEGQHVDHEVPLQGENISGLHVLSNLRYLSPSENSSKGNRFKSEIEYYGLS